MISRLKEIITEVETSAWVTAVIPRVTTTLDFRWPEGKVPYLLEVEDWELPLIAINHWNEINKDICTFVPKTPQDKYHVIFRVSTTSPGPSSKVGCLRIRAPQEILLPRQYSTGQPVKMEDILHEMMHTVGFYHEMSRHDRDKRVFVPRKLVEEQDQDYLIQGLDVSHFDIYSLMCYEEGTDSIVWKGRETKAVAGHAITFSQGDRSAIRVVYGKSYSHHGEWHPPGQDCKLKSPDQYCSYSKDNKSGHWSCCHDERSENLVCQIQTSQNEHTGFWHEKSPEMEGREFCAYGCLDPGMTGHWSCCQNSEFTARCRAPFTKSYFVNLDQE